MIGAALRLLALTGLLLAGGAHAHKPSDSYLMLDVGGTTIEGRWDIALRDLEFALGLDANRDGAITWGEVKAKHAEIASYALARLTLGPPHAPCVAVPRDQPIDEHTDGAYAVLRFTATCAEAPKVLPIGYGLFFDVDLQHRGLVSLTAQGATRAVIMGVDAAAQKFTLGESSSAAQFADYLKEGVLHIWAGLDHVLFLLSLLLPAVLVRSRVSGEAWTPAPNFAYALCDVVKVVTAFTVAHSITLSLAALGVVALPSRLVESAIAASVVLAALNNVWPVVHGGRWVFAFAFGLVHGFGFAGVLAGLGLPQDTLLPALVAFNVGVELGQLAIVAVFLPVAYALRDTRLYRRGVLAGGSLLVAAIALLWLGERSFDVALPAGLSSGS